VAAEASAVPETAAAAKEEVVEEERAGTGASVPEGLADGFDYPVGEGLGDGYYVAHGFWPGQHGGEDWNGRGGGNTDLGDPIHCIGDGEVVASGDYGGGHGQVVMTRHRYREDDGAIKVIDAYYGPLSKRLVEEGDVVSRGEVIGEMGNNEGMYVAHLCFQIRKNLDIGVKKGSQYTIDYKNYHSPRRFIDEHRPFGW
jgi:murein DD-endopeptidase MepM/ murein hydrolase activator NlpD